MAERLSFLGKLKENPYLDYFIHQLTTEGNATTAEVTELDSKLTTDQTLKHLGYVKGLSRLGELLDVEVEKLKEDLSNQQE